MSCNFYIHLQVGLKNQYNRGNRVLLWYFKIQHTWCTHKSIPCKRSNIFTDHCIKNISHRRDARPLYREVSALSSVTRG